MNESKTTIQIRKETRDYIESKKIIPRESLKDVIDRLLGVDFKKKP